MRIHPSVASVVGQTNQTDWGQVFVSPEAYGVIQVHDETGVALQLGVNMLAKATHLLSIRPKSLKEVEHIADSLIIAGVKSLILLVPIDHVLYIVERGMGAVYLKRDGKLACLMNTPGAISGEVRKDDSLLLVNSAFKETLAPTELVTLFDHLPAQDVAEKLTLILHEKKGAPGSAGLVFQVTEFIDEAEEMVEEEGAAPEPPVSPNVRIPVERLELPGDRFSGIKRRLHTGFDALTAFRTDRLNRKRNFWIAVSGVLLLLFLGSVALGVKKQAANNKTHEYVQAATEGEKAFEEGTALLELNALKGREKLTEAKNILEPYMHADLTLSKEGRRLSALYQQVTDALTQAMQIVKGEPEIFFDATLLKKDANIHSFSLYQDTLALLDTNQKTVYVVGVATKNGQVVGGGDGFETSQLVAMGSDAAYVLTSKGVNLIRANDKKAKMSVIPKDDQWGSIGAFVSYGGNLYLVDTEKSRIWKYIATDTGFTTIREYLNPDTLPNLQTVTSMAIDGSVWVGTSDGKVLRFTQGKENPLRLQGIDPTLGNYLQVYTDDESSRVYILDRDNKRVVVVDKDGVYVAQYVWSGDVKPDGIVVSEAQKKILLLSGGTIYALALK